MSGVHPMIVFIRCIHALPGGFKDTVTSSLSTRPTSTANLELAMSSQAFLERLLFNRNTLLAFIPEKVFSSKVLRSKEVQLNLRCAMAELGGTRFQSEAIDLISFSGGERKEALKAYRERSTLRLSELSADKLQTLFEKAWPPIAYDSRIIDNMRTLSAQYADAFDSRELEAFLDCAFANLELFKTMKPGREAFRDALMLERFQDSYLWGMDIWEADTVPEFEQPPLLELVERLADAFASQGYASGVISDFIDKSSDCFGLLIAAKMRKKLSHPTMRYEHEYFERLEDEGYTSSALSYFKRLCEDEDAYPTPEDAYRELLYATSKGTLIYNIVISALYGPASAVDNCYIEKPHVPTRITAAWKEPLRPVGPLQAGRGEAVIREVSVGSAYNVALINLDNLPLQESLLITVVGREFQTPTCNRPSEEPGSLSEKLRVEETEEKFYSCGGEATSVRHCGIYSIGGKVHIVDLGSTNGTRLYRAGGLTVEVPTDAKIDSGKCCGIALERGDLIVLPETVFEVL